MKSGRSLPDADCASSQAPRGLGCPPGTPPVPVIFINRYFHPDLSATSQLLSDLAFALAGRGRSVRVITSRLRYDAADGRPGLPAREVVKGVEVWRVRTSGFGRARLLGRAVDYLTFYLSAAWCLWQLARAGDVVVAKTDPPMVSVAASLVCLLRRAHLVNWLQDLFPEVARALGIGRRWRLGYALLSRVRTASLRRAVANVVIGRGMATRVEALGVSRDRIRIIPNWADPAEIRPIAHAENPVRRDAGFGDAFVIAYSGNLGRVHDVATLLEAMTILARKQAGPDRPGAGPGLRWLFVGGGALTPVLKAEAARRGLTDIAFWPYQPRSALSRTLAAADAHLASLRPEFEGLVVPSKVTGAMAAGRPILFVGDPDGEIGRLIARHGCGCVIAAGDGPGLADAVRALARDRARGEDMGRRARRAFEAEFDRATALARWDALLDAVARGDRLTA